jgi:hypothetical protein
VKNAFFRSIYSSRVQGIAACALLTGTAMLLMQYPAPAQDEGAGLGKAKAPTGPAPKLSDGKPDFSGVWSPDRTFIYDINEALKKGDTLPIQPWALELTKKRPSVEDPEANCLPTGVPRMAPYPWSIAQSPTNIYFLFEGNIHSYRTIFMDGRKHSADPNPTWYGESIGHYEGQTLVIDSIGFNDKFWFDFAGHPHTEKLHIIERYRRPDLGHLEWESVIDDPGAYTKPFTMYGHSTLQQHTDLMEYICQENNKDLSHIVGKDARNKYAREEEKAASKAVYGGR